MILFPSDVGFEPNLRHFERSQGRQGAVGGDEDKSGVTVPTYLRAERFQHKTSWNERVPSFESSLFQTIAAL